MTYICLETVSGDQVTDENRNSKEHQDHTESKEKTTAHRKVNLQSINKQTNSINYECMDIDRHSQIHPHRGIWTDRQMQTNTQTSYLF